jgi:hypothetical protein
MPRRGVRRALQLIARVCRWLLPPADFNLIATDVEKWARVIKAAGITPI